MRKAGATHVLGDVLEGKGHLLTEGVDDGDDDLLAVLESLLNVLAKLVLGDLDVVLGVSVVVHQVEESVVNVDELELGSGDDGRLHVVGRGGDVLKLLLGEDLLREARCEDGASTKVSPGCNWHGKELV